MTWNLLPFLELDAASQMATDTVFLRRCESNPDTAYLRFYQMNPPSVTIGRHQRWRRVIDETACAVRGWDWVRRPTGGGALLHANEINYAIALGRSVMSDLGLSDLRSVFGWIAQGLSDALRTLHVETDVLTGQPVPPSQRTSGASRQHGLCGRSLTRYEVSSGGRKLIAAAQQFSTEAILQHGTLYLRAPSSDDRFWPNELASRSTSHRDAIDDITQSWSDISSSGACQRQSDVAGWLGSGFIQSARLSVTECPLSDLDLQAISDCRLAWARDGWHKRR